MSDPSKSKSPFSFGTPATSGGSGNLLGQSTPNTQALAGGLFSSSKPTSTSGGNLFGSITTAPSTSLFDNNSGTNQNSSVFAGVGGGGGGSNAFGGANKTTSFNFAQPSNNTASGGTFGSDAGSQATQVSSSTAPSNPFGNLTTPNKPPESSAGAQNQPSNRFGGGVSTGGSGFFGSSEAQINTTTPTSKPSTGLFGNSTTPAGPPPNAGSGSVLNFGKQPIQTDNPFGKAATTSTTQGTSSTPNLSFGGPLPNTGGLFGASKPQDSVATTSAAQTSGIFSTAPKNDNKRSAQPDGKLFSNPSKSQNTGPNQSTSSQQPQNETPEAPSLFPNLGGQQVNSDSSKSTFSFAKPSAPAGSSGIATTSSSAPPSMFSGVSSQHASLGTPAESTSTPSLNFFQKLGKQQEKPTTAFAETIGSSTPSTTAAAPTSGTFGTLGKAPALSDTAQAPAQGSKVGAAGVPISTLDASTAGPPPTAQSRLKNKSMDEIITRWASDLSKYQKEFQKQAEKVAHWDRMLVENSGKIQRLYGSTLEAERATTEVERQLSAVENDQAELELWLDHYEKEVDSMVTNQVGQGEGLSGPDAERERT